MKRLCTYGTNQTRLQTQTDNALVDIVAVMQVSSALSCRELTQMLTQVKAHVGNCIVRHEPAATASEGAKALRFPGMCCLKAVVVRLDGTYAMCAVPCTRCVDLAALAKLAGVAEARLASASELRERVPAAQVRLAGSARPAVMLGITLLAYAMVIDICSLRTLGVFSYLDL